MATATRAVLTVTTGQERGYLAARHGLHPACSPATIEDLASAVAGLHAARLPTPFVTLRARLPSFAAKELRQALEPGATLIKLRTCRRTLHIYPLHEAPAAHTATLRQRLAACAATVRRLGEAPEILLRIAPSVREALAVKPLAHRELEHRVLAASAPVHGCKAPIGELVRLTIKWLWESGELIYRNAADSLHREHREFHLATTAHPTLHLDHAPVDDAIRLLLRRYLRAFGPASVEDMRWWSGLTRGEITPALDALRRELIEVRLPGDDAAVLMFADDEDALRTAEPLPPHYVTLLAYEDPSLKGYFSTRRRYVDHEYRATLFNSIGEARASIALAGRCVGTWQYDKRTRTISHSLFTAIPKGAQVAMAQRRDQMTEFLRSEPSSPHPVG